MKTVTYSDGSVSYKWESGDFAKLTKVEDFGGVKPHYLEPGTIVKVISKRSNGLMYRVRANSYNGLTSSYVFGSSLEPLSNEETSRAIKAFTPPEPKTVSEPERTDNGFTNWPTELAVLNIMNDGGLYKSLVLAERAPSRMQCHSTFLNYVHRNARDFEDCEPDPFAFFASVNWYEVAENIKEVYS
jgi:hypothetical protein